MNENQNSFAKIEAAARFLKLDLTSQEIADYAINCDLPSESISAIEEFLTFLQRRKRQRNVDTLHKLSGLPMRNPKTFGNFTFDRFHGRQARELEDLQNLSALHARRNLAFIGPQGIGKTHLAMAYGYQCCEEGYKTYFLKASELNQRMSEARRDGRQRALISSLVKPSCLIVDEIGYCTFDDQNTRMFFDVVDRRYSKDVDNTMIITSNAEPDRWVEFFKDEPALKSAMDRYFDNALVIFMRGASYRGTNRRKIEVIAGTEPEYKRSEQESQKH